MEKWLTESNSQRKNILENQKEILHYKVMKPVLNIGKKPSPVVIVFDRKEIKHFTTKVYRLIQFTYLN